MDKTLLNNYAHAIRARPILNMLPAGLREHCLQYEQMCMEDIRAQLGNPELTESEALARVSGTTSKIVQALLPVAGEIALAMIKKYAPAIATSGAVSAGLTYLATKYMGGM